MLGDSLPVCSEWILPGFFNPTRLIRKRKAAVRMRSFRAGIRLSRVWRLGIYTTLDTWTAIGDSTRLKRSKMTAGVEKWAKHRRIKLVARPRLSLYFAICRIHFLRQSLIFCLLVFLNSKQKQVKKRMLPQSLEYVDVLFVKGIESSQIFSCFNGTPFLRSDLWSIRQLSTLPLRALSSLV